MKKIGSHFLLIILITFFSNSVFSQNEEVSFYIEASKDRLTISDRLRIDFVMNVDGDDFQPPNFSNFRIIGGPNQSVSHSWVNGKQSFKKTYSYFLTPLKKGSYTIGQAKIIINGETYKTIPKKITVLSAEENTSVFESNNNSNANRENLLLFAQVSKTNPYINESVQVNYKLCYKSNLSIANFNLVEDAKNHNFLKHIIELKKYSVKRDLVNGKPYNCASIRKLILYPQKPKQLFIDPITLDVTLEQPTGEFDFFGRRLHERVHRTISSKRKNIRVKPLPNGKPDNFTGAVGQFEFTIKTNKTELRASESLSVKIIISGKGNLKTFKLPEINFPSSFEVYDPEFNQKIKTTSSGLMGNLSNNYTVIPQFKGTYTIPAIPFSYFDPKKNIYVTLYSKKKIITITENPQVRQHRNESSTIINSLKNTITNSTEEQFKFIKLKTTFLPMKQMLFYRSSTFYILLCLPFVLLPVIIFIARKRLNTNLNKQHVSRKRSNKLAKKYLFEAKKKTTDSIAFYEALEKALHNFLKAKLGLDSIDLNKHIIQSSLNEKNIPEEDVKSMINIIESCEVARYTPVSSTAIKTDYGNSVEIIAKLDKQL